MTALKARTITLGTSNLIINKGGEIIFIKPKRAADRNFKDQPTLNFIEQEVCYAWILEQDEKGRMQRFHAG